MKWLGSVLISLLLVTTTLWCGDVLRGRSGPSALCADGRPGLADCSLTRNCPRRFCFQLLSELSLPSGRFLAVETVLKRSARTPCEARYDIAAFARRSPSDTSLAFTISLSKAFVKRFNETMTLALMFRDRPVGRITSGGFEYELAEQDRPGWLDALRTGAWIVFAGAPAAFSSSATVH